MLKYILATTLLMGLTHLSAQQDSVFRSTQILRIEQTLMDALPGDTTPWSRILDDACYIITEDGTGYNKKEFLQTFYPFPRDVTGHIRVINPVFTFHDRIAIIHYVADEYENVKGQMLHTSYAAADTYYQYDTSWRMIGSQIFEIPRLPSAINLTSRLLQEYTGTYAMADSDRAVISLRGDTLFIQKKKKHPAPLYAETVNVFFQSNDTRGRKIFIRQENGDMLLLERRNGNDLIWKRIGR